MTVAQLAEAWRRKHLASAEPQVIELVAAGIAAKAVARRLNKSTATVCNRRYNGMRKLGRWQ